ncbi:MAG: DUF2065 domain-containing protein [Pseudomonadota bacterium]
MSSSIAGLIAGFGVFLMLEGLLYAALTQTTRSLAGYVASSDGALLQKQGLFALALSVFLVWIIGAQDMHVLLVGLFIMMAIEGTVYAGFPNGVRRLASHVCDMRISDLRAGGLIAMAKGATVVWLALG